MRINQSCRCGGMLFSSVFAVGAGMKTIEYERFEFHGDPERRSAELSVFVYDIPHFGACGVFPPLHIANEIFSSGGFEGGMGPGATWRPFEISRDEYEQLVQVIRVADPKRLGDQARYAWVKYDFDGSFDHIQEWQPWLTAVCEKHRETYQKRQSRV